MLQFFPVGSKAARNQFLAATAVSVFAIVVIGNLCSIGISFSLGGTTAEINTTCPWLATYWFVAWSDVILATGFSLTCSGGLDVTVANMKKASRLMSPREPRLPLKALASLTGISAALGGVVALEPPPSWLAQGHADDLAGVALASAWPGLISTAVAYLGSNTRAAIRALG